MCPDEGAWPTVNWGTRALYAGLPPYNVQADGRTVADAAIAAASNRLSSATAGFTGADIGKLCVVLGAGAAGAHLYTTIQQVQNGVAVLAANAGTTVNAAECFYATDDTAAIQACVTAAAALGGVAAFPEGDMGISAPITAPAAQAVTLQGVGPVKEFYGGTTAFDDADFPTIAPYLKGSIFVQCSPNVDGVQLNAQGVAHHTKWLGVRFAGKFRNTGHGFVSSPPGGKLGNIGGVIEDLRVFGHDGNHYGHVVDSPELMRWVGLRSYGGGGILLKTNATNPGPPGNITSLDTYSMTFLGGSAHGFLIDCSNGQYIDYSVFINAEHVVSTPATQPLGTSAPTNAQQPVQYLPQGSHPSCVCIGFVNPCMESNIAGAKSTFPYGPGCYRTNDPAQTAVQNPIQTNPGNGTSYQNLSGKFQLWIHSFTLQPLAAASASTTLNGATAAGATSIVVTSATGIAAGSVLQIDTGTLTEWAIVDSSYVSGTTIPLLQAGPGFAGLINAHLTGVAVQVGAAMVVGQVSNSGAYPGQKWAGPISAPIGATAVQQQLLLPIPSGYFYKVNWGNAQRMWTDATGLSG